jgi:hypothetical protein
LLPLIEGKVEQGCEHACGQFDGYAFHPVEGLPHGQVIEHVTGALADHRCELAQGLGADGGADGATLHVVLGPVHGDEHGQLEVVERIADRDCRLRGKDLVRRVHGHDVVVARHGPVGPEFAVAAEVHRRLVAQALEPRPVSVRLEQERIGDIDVLEGDGVGVDVHLVRVVLGYGCVHAGLLVIMLACSGF